MIGCLLAIHFFKIVSVWLVFVHVALLRLSYHCGFNVENLIVLNFFVSLMQELYINWTCKDQSFIVHSPVRGAHNVANVKIISPQGLVYIP